MLAVRYVPSTDSGWFCSFRAGAPLADGGRMGTWGFGPFDNDTAGDWGDALDRSSDAAQLARETLAESAADDIDAACRTVAAAAWVARCVPDGPSCDDHYAPQTHIDRPDPSLCEQALEALLVATAPGSTWYQIWEWQAAQAVEALAPTVDALRRHGHQPKSG